MLICGFALAGAAQARERVAVLELANPAGLTAQEVGYLTDLVRDAARENLRRDTFLIMTRQNVQDLIGDQSLSDCIGDCAVETGRNLGAAYVVAGEVIRFGTSLRASLSLHETASGNLVEIEQVRGDTVEDLESQLGILGETLFLPLRQQYGAADSPVYGTIEIGEPDWDDAIPLATPASLDTGKQLMRALRERTGGASYDGIRRFRQVGELQATIQGRDLAFHLESTVIPPEHYHRSEKTSLGTFARVLAGAEAWSVSPGGTRELTGEDFRRLQDEVRNEWIVILRDLESARCQSLEPRRLDGVMCHPVRVTVGRKSQVFFLDSETGLVRMVRVQEIHPVTNDPTLCTIHVDTYVEQGRFRVPGRTRITYDNEDFGVYTLTSLEINPEVDRSLFRK